MITADIDGEFANFFIKEYKSMVDGLKDENKGPQAKQVFP